MYNHAPAGYECHLCRIVAGLENEGWNAQSDVFWRTEHITALINVRWWAKTPGHALVIPNQHIENIYDMTPDIAVHVHEAARQVAIAFKRVYGCDGTSTRQHNEPAGYQEVFHYHLHVFPRYYGDNLYEDNHAHRLTSCDERRPYADKLRVYFDHLTTQGTI
ncbi:MAG: HIT family protein [Anaerolineae bacterium]|nr:HIT family protein [Anaerolineae bacterium]